MALRDVFGKRGDAELAELLAQLVFVRAVAGEDDLVVVAAELGHVLGDLLEPERGRLVVEAGRRQLDDAVALLVEPVEQLREQRIGDDRDAPGARVRAQPRSSSSRRRSSFGS
jgi:hypothetical protein